MNHTTQLCGSYSTQLYTTLHNRFAEYSVTLSFKDVASLKKYAEIKLIQPQKI